MKPTPAESLESQPVGPVAAAVDPTGPPQPLPTPPLAADVILSLAFIWAGWYLWRRGRGLRWAAAILWVLAAAGIFTVVAVLTTR